MRAKKYILPWPLILCLISCEKVPESIIGPATVQVEFGATLDDSIYTKTICDDSNQMALWKREDMVGVIASYGPGTNTDAVMLPFSIKERDNKGDEFLSNVTFAGSLTDLGAQEYTYYALSPFKAFQSVGNESSFSSRLEERQFPDLRSWDGACDMLASKPLTVNSASVAADGLELRFTRLFGMLRLRFGSSILDTYGPETVETISIESADPSDVLAGKFTVDLSSHEAPDPVMSMVTGEHFSKVTLDYRCKNATLADINAYFVLCSGEYDEVIITVKTSAHTLTLPRTGLSVSRGSISSATIKWKDGDEAEEATSLLPKNPSSLKVFTFGNSFTSNSMQYIDDLMNAAGITNVTFAHFYIGSCSLKTHWEHTQNQGNIKGGTDLISYNKRYFNGTKVIESSEQKTVIDALCDEPWDVVVLQTVSSEIGLYDKFAPYVPKMVDYIKTTCQRENGKAPVIAWHMPWAFGTQHANLKKLYYGDQAMNYEAHVESAKKVMRESEIQLVITTGTAIQNLRNSSLNKPYSGDNAYEFLSDGLHLDTAGQYTAACTWFEFFMKPCFGISIMGNSYVPPSVAGDREIYQRAAVLACKYPFEISHLDEILPEDTPHEGDETDFNVVGSTENLSEGSTSDQPESFTLIDNLTW